MDAEVSPCRCTRTDSKTVSLLALACFHPHPKVQSSAVRFFLGDLHSAEDGGSEEESDDEPNVPDVSKLQHARKVNKKTRSGDKKVRAAAALARRRRREHQDGRDEKVEGDGRANLAAVHMLNDPQGFGEKLFESLSRGDKRINIELKVRMMQLLARVMGAHRLSVLPFYSYIVKSVSSAFYVHCDFADAVAGPVQVFESPPTLHYAHLGLIGTVGAFANSTRRTDASAAQACRRLCAPRRRARGGCGGHQCYSRDMPKAA